MPVADLSVRRRVRPDSGSPVFQRATGSPDDPGFAAILHQGLDGQPAGVIAAVPADFGYDLGLASVVSPLRLRGLAGMLARIKAAIARAG